MAEFVDNCSRCGAKSITFDVLGDSPATSVNGGLTFEILSKCRACGRCSIAFLYDPDQTDRSYAAGTMTGYNGNLLHFLKFQRFMSVADVFTREPPEHLPEAVANCFKEGSAAFSIGAYNAAAAMFRLALDIASKGLLPSEPAESGGPNSSQRKRLYDRLEYLFDNRLIAPELRDLADCVREDGNDGAHDGSLTKADAEDLIDFAEQLLERVYTEPARLRDAKSRRAARRAGEA